MPKQLVDIARVIEAQPWNRPGSDKTWVLNALTNMQRFQTEVHRAKRVGRP